MREEHVLDLLPGYALGSLDDEDLVKVARHLPHCAVCQAEVEGYRQTVERLTLAQPLRTPPADLRARVVARVERAALAEARRPRAEPARPSRRAAPDLPGWWNRLGVVVGALAVIAALALGILNLSLARRLSALEARVPQGQVHIVRLAGTTEAAQSQGYLVVFPGEAYGTLVVHDAPLLDPAYQYQIWLIRDGKRTSGGVFSVDEHGYGSLMIEAGQPLDSFQSFGITIEPAGGSPGPTGKKIMGGDL